MGTKEPCLAYRMGFFPSFFATFIQALIQNENTNKINNHGKRLVDVVVMSGLHLGTFSCQSKEIVNYLKGISRQILIRNGDIIGGWEFNEQRHTCYLFTGNHDEMLHRYSDTQPGNES